MPHLFCVETIIFSNGDIGQQIAIFTSVRGNYFVFIGNICYCFSYSNVRSFGWGIGSVSRPRELKHYFQVFSNAYQENPFPLLWHPIISSI